MAAKLFVGVTDNDWYFSLRNKDYDEINFWKPGKRPAFKALSEGDMFLFKLHSPLNYIAGGAFFLRFITTPASLAWDAFGPANGTDSFTRLVARVHKYRRTDRLSDPDPTIGCIMLSAPFFFHEHDWISPPGNWSNSIVQGKGYDTSEHHGRLLYEKVQQALLNKNSDLLMPHETPGHKRYGSEVLVRPRLGQSSFRMLVADAYQKRCAITGERTVPALESAHIKPYSVNGPHEISNGLLLRRDFHTLFDRGYITVTKDFIVEVSKHIKADFGNGKEYYAHDGSKLMILPGKKEDLPARTYLEWHNQNVYIS